MNLSGYEKTLHQTCSYQRAIYHMRLSIEAKVAAAVAIAFAALSIGAIAQEQSEHGTGGPNGQWPDKQPPTEPDEPASIQKFFVRALVRVELITGTSAQACSNIICCRC
jgi:hypothetical protein